MIRILLIEDDDISRAFLAEALSGPGCTVTAAEAFQPALMFCRADRFDLIVSDIHLGDGSLHEMAPRLPAGIPVLATSAEANAGVRDRLTALGINALLAKPATVAETRNAVEHVLAKAVYRTATPVWDDEQAFRALGRNSAALMNLKSLFKLELPDMAGKIRHAFDSGDTDAVHAHLHKLKASCGFLGANRLLRACNALDETLDAERLACFMQALDDTLATL